MRATYRQNDAGPIVNIARYPRGTAISSNGQYPKWQADRWGGDGSYSLVTGIGGHPEGITTAIRYTVTGTVRTSHGFHIAGNVEATPPSVNISQMLPAKAGEVLHMSAWLRYTGTSTQAYRFRVRPTNADASAYLSIGSEAAPVSLPSGAWVRVSFTYTVPPGTGYLAIFLTNNNSIPDAAGDTIDGTGLMATRTPAPQANIASDPYATATTIPNGRFGWTPRWFGGGGATGTTVPTTEASDGPDGISTYLRKTWTTVGTNVQDVAYTHTATGVRPTQGEVFTIGSYFRASKGWTVTQHCRLVIAWYDGIGAQIGANVFGPNIPAVTAGTWHRLSITATAPVNAVTMFAYQQVYVENGAWAPGDTIDGTGLMVTRNPSLWKFADGRSPGWRWLGAVDTSESVGYARPTP